MNFKGLQQDNKNHTSQKSMSKKDKLEVSDSKISWISKNSKASKLSQPTSMQKFKVSNNLTYLMNKNEKQMH